MCGIVGFVDFKKKSTKEVLKNMTNVIAHRGPDDAGYSFYLNEKESIGLGHRRLSVLDLSSDGHQPMSFKNLTIVYNGEVYNFHAIREELIEVGFTFDSNSDTEVILKSFDHWGIKAVDKFIGMFAFFIYDKDRKKCYIVRDRAGVKPLYYYWKSGVFLFGSELKSFHQHPNFEKIVSKDSLAQFLQYGYILQPYSIFENTFKLKAGHYLELNLKEQSFEEKKYWDVYDFYKKPKLELSEAEVISESEKILKKAIDYRMVSDVPVGVFLSGGYDSSLVTALLQSDRKEKINTFTIGFHEKGFDEAPYAKSVSEHLGTNHTEYYCTQKDAKEILPKLVDIYDEPFGDSSAIPTILVSQLAREKVTVALSADGGDEIFAGYNKYDAVIDFYNRYNSYPKRLRHLCASSMRLTRKFTPSYALSRKLDIRASIIKSDTLSELLKVSSQKYKNRDIQTLFKKEVDFLKTSFDDDLSSSVEEDLNQLLAVDYKTYMNDNILTKVDRATMSVALEGREPLLDQNIIEFLAQVDSKIKYKNRNKKYILKEITHKYLPKKLMDRPKKGFSVPIFEWFKDELKEYILYYLDTKRIEEEGIFNSDVVAYKREQYLGGNLKDINEIWYLLIFEMWYEKWIKN
ncbi:Asparagine synthetase [glutamine-hydrolyzing] [hydrothermal vent metagenome]|uniref:Asparagine synthetase [glutamine-hydrolyzing] n=1 Tax=hydrothermal vent metagenome TaxID=652676 RepID=A0A1W1CB73_9ZZZZ